MQPIKLSFPGWACGESLSKEEVYFSEDSFITWSCTDKNNLLLLQLEEFNSKAIPKSTINIYLIF